MLSNCASAAPGAQFFHNRILSTIRHITIIPLRCAGEGCDLMKDYDQFELWLQRGAEAGAIGDETEYPIAGARKVLEGIAARACEMKPEKALCLGAGSEYAARALYNIGCDVWIIDLNAERLAELRREMPNAHFIHDDFLDEIPDEIFEDEFGVIICTYSMHFLNNESKFMLLSDLFSMLTDDGRLFLGDVCFWTTAEREMCRIRCREAWDSEASYIVYDRFCRDVSEEFGIDNLTRFTRVSHCAGIIEVGFGLD